MAADGQPLFFLQHGDSGEPLVLLHGLFGMGKNLSSIARSLASQHRVYAFDLPNHGRSPHSEQMSIDSLVDAVLAMLDSLQLERVNLLGHSLGGKVAMALALRCAERVARLVVVDIAPVAYPPQHRPLIDTLEDLDLSRCTRRAELEAALLPRVQEPALRQLLLQNVDSTPSGLSWRFNLSAISAHYDGLMAALSLPVGGRPYCCPTLFVAGQHSDYLTERELPAARALFPVLRLQSLAAGHWLHVERSEQFNQLLADFLANS